MKKIFAIAAWMTVMMPMAAQETYENAKIAQEDLNGTARYVGMGGAMEALGADISTMSSNPAGIGMFRRSTVSLSASVVSQTGVSNQVGGSKANASFDQLGFVLARRMDKNSFLNIGFNYHKSRNFDMILSAADNLQNASLNKLTWAKGVNGLFYPQQNGAGDVEQYNADKTFAGYNYHPNFDTDPYITCNQLDDLLGYRLNYNQDYENGPYYWSADPAQNYQFNRAHKGWISEFDFNISGNINNRIYLGLTVGLHDVHYKHYSEYAEGGLRHTYTDQNGNVVTGNPYSLTVADDREITGTGFEIKAGVIVRPIEASPFRVGLYASSPVFYTLRTKNYTYITDGPNTFDSQEVVDAKNGRCNYKFKLYTPWKFGVSLGHTIGQNIALGMTYEYADYGSMDSRNITEGYYDYDYDYDSSSSDKAMNQHTERTLKGVHTLKIGGEYKPTKNLSLRMGYNYVSPMYNKDGYKDGTLNSYGSYVASATDYTNWEDTHRFTLGAGYTYQKFNIALAYQYSMTNGTFYPFMSYEDSHDAAFDNIADGVKVSNKRNQLILTLGYTF